MKGLRDNCVWLHVTFFMILGTKLLSIMIFNERTTRDMFCMTSFQCYV